MDAENRLGLMGIAIGIPVGCLLAWVGSSGGNPAFAWIVFFCFVVQWIAFFPAYRAQTEKTYDLIGSSTYVAAVLLGGFLSVPLYARDCLLISLVIIWALRLGAFLYLRVQQTGADTRFDSIKPYFFKFLMAWTIQGLWVAFTLAAALAAITSGIHVPLGFFALLGTLLWIVGFTMEVVADAQKRVHRLNKSGQFIQTGLWSVCRHPNYFGEILLWVGIACIAFPELSSWQLLTLSSPLFVFVLLRYISGIPILETRANERWGHEPAYQKYKSETPLLLPRLWK